MTPEQAITQINSMRFRPGWTFRARQDYLCKDDEVFVEAEVRSWDTSYRAADGTLTKPMTLRPYALIDVAKLDEAGLCCALIRELVRPFDDHEDREFMSCPRPGGRWQAPLHPHTLNGELEWAKGADDRAIKALGELVRS